MGRRSGGRKIIIPIIGHPHKFTTSDKWARQMRRRGKCTIVEGICYWFTGHAFHTHQDRDRDYATGEIHGVEWRHKKSGQYGPIVMQAETGLPVKSS